MRINIENVQRHVALVRRRFIPALRFFMEKAARSGTSGGWGEVSVVLCDEASIRYYNQRCFGRDESTDVISVRYEPTPGDEGNRGEIILNLERAVALGPRYGGADHELGLYVAHGCDHLVGYDDRTRKERLRMRRRELTWIRDAVRAGLLTGLIGAKTAIGSGRR